MIKKLVDALVSVAVNVLSNRIDDEIKDVKFDKEIRSLMRNYVEKQQEKFDNADLNNEVVYAGLSEYLIKSLGDIKEYILGFPLGSKEGQLNTIIEKAQEAANADTSVKKDVVKAFIKNAIVIIQIGYYDNAGTDAQLTMRILSDLIEENHRELSQKIEELLKKVIDNMSSAEKHNCEPKSKIDFHYASGTVGFSGREDEIKRLHGFCDSEGLMRWWMVTGEGGTGKSRLSYEFRKQMRKEGWDVCAPSDHDRETLDKCSGKLPKNTLFVLDYAEYDASSIGKWIKSLTVDGYKDIKIRVLLIQRFAEGIDKFDHFPKEYFYNEDNEEFLQLEPISKKSLIKIITEYTPQKTAENETYNEITPEAAQKIYDNLAKIDKEFLRPLYAIILADVYIQEGKINLTNYQALEHIYDREIKAVKEVIQGVFEHKDVYWEDLYNAVFDIRTIATMTNGMNVKQEMKEFLPERYDDLMNILNTKTYRENFYDMEFFEGKKEPICLPYEPDIIGEYFVLKQFKKGRNAQEFINAAWRKSDLMTRFMNRLFQDHAQWIDENFAELKQMMGTVILPEGMEKIPDEAFLFNTNMTKVEIPDSVTSIGEYAFYECINLKEIKIPDSVTSIGECAFWDCESLKEIKIPNSVTFIGEVALGGCAHLDKIIVNENNPFFVSDSGVLLNKDKTILISYPCNNASNTYNIPDSVTSIGKHAFYECINLKEITIPNSIASIEAFVFRDCHNLTKINIPNSVTSIGYSAFEYCESLTEIKIPNSVTSIWEMAFRGCKNLKDVYAGRKVMPLIMDHLDWYGIHPNYHELP